MTDQRKERIKILGRYMLLIVVLASGVAAVYQLVLDYPFLSMKLKGRAPDCPWWKILGGTNRLVRFHDLAKASYSTLREKAADPNLDLVLLASPERDFWIRRQGDEYDGPHLLAYLLAEQQWMEELDPEAGVRRGDVVIDCGAHVGVFTHKALMRGAARVIAVEPDAVSLECLRRNFARELLNGTVTVVSKAVWKDERMLSFKRSGQNSGSNTVVSAPLGDVEVPATTIDRLVAEFGRIDFIKMDIEGAERAALAGAGETLKRYKPRLAIEAYHLVDDGHVLPSIILSANPNYSIACGICGIMHGMAIPYIFYGR